LGQSFENIDATLAQLCISDSFAHEIRNDRTLVLCSEGPIELGLDVIGDAEVDGCHETHLVELFNNEDSAFTGWG